MDFLADQLGVTETARSFGTFAAPAEDLYGGLASALDRGGLLYATMPTKEITNGSRHPAVSRRRVAAAGSG